MLKNLKRSFWFQLCATMLPGLIVLSTTAPLTAYGETGCKKVIAAHAPVKAKRGFATKAWNTIAAALLLGLTTAGTAEAQYGNGLGGLGERDGYTDSYRGMEPWKFKSEYVKVRIIDQFQDPKKDSKVQARTPEETKAFRSFNVPEVLGGQRGVSVTVAGDGVATSEIVTAGAPYLKPGETETFMQYQQVGAAQGNYDLRWDGTTQVTVTPNGLVPPVDLTENGADRFYLDLTKSTNYGSFIVTVFDAADTTGQTFSQGRMFYYYVHAETYYVLPFKNLKPGPKGHADLKRIGAITLSVDVKSEGVQQGQQQAYTQLIHIIEFGTAKAPCIFLPSCGIGGYPAGSLGGLPSLGGGYGGAAPIPPSFAGLGMARPPSTGGGGGMGGGQGSGQGQGQGQGKIDFSVSLSQQQSQHQHQTQFQHQHQHQHGGHGHHHNPPEGNVVPEPAAYIQALTGLFFLAGGYYFFVYRKQPKPATMGN